MKNLKKYLLLLVVAVIALGVVGCTETPDTKEQSAYEKIDKKAKKREPYIPKNDTEFANYNGAQKLYDTPSTIIWCSTTWGNASAPLVTVPVAGKLTSSSTTFFAPEKLVDHGNYSWSVTQARSVDGLFHPNPPQYRYGFTPGGQYVDFFNMPTFCTTALTKFQRQETRVSVAVDDQARTADRLAQEALRNGDKAKAQSILEGLGE